jgi:hypothetical protein
MVYWFAVKSSCVQDCCAGYVAYNALLGCRAPAAAATAAVVQDDQTTSAYSALREKLFDPVRPWT